MVSHSLNSSRVQKTLLTLEAVMGLRENNSHNNGGEGEKRRKERGEGRRKESGRPALERALKGGAKGLRSHRRPLHSRRETGSQAQKKTTV